MAIDQELFILLWRIWLFDLFLDSFGKIFGEFSSLIAQKSRKFLLLEKIINFQASH